MLDFVAVLSCILLSLFALTGLIVFKYIRVLNAKTPNEKSNLRELKTAVILSLRGADPFLKKCLDALLRQDYSNYEIKIVVDSKEDPAWQIIDELSNERDLSKVQLSVLRDRGENCTLKCSAISQAVSDLDESFEAIALVDADAIPDKNWLRSLTTPLHDDSVGVTTGNRWYMPSDTRWGSITRYIWNTAAIIQMYINEIAWGGSLAIRTDTIKKTNLLERWSRAFGDDTSLKEVLDKHDLKTVFIPSQIIVNRETCSLKSFYGFSKRQLISARVDHTKWVLIAIHGILNTLVPISLVAIFIASLFAGKTALAISLATIAAFFVINLLSIAFLESAVTIILIESSIDTKWLTPTHCIKIALALPLAYLVNSVALIGAFLADSVIWREIKYEVSGHANIRMRKYTPFNNKNSGITPLESGLSSI